MGSCQSKKNVQQPRKQVKNPQSSANLAPVINTDDENENIESGFQPNDIPQDANKVAEQLVDGRNSQFENPLSDITEGSFMGNFVLVQALIKKHNIDDISTLKGYDKQVTLGSGSLAKTYENTTLWNPLLLAISQKHLTIVKLFFDKVPHFHKTNTLSKPYSLKEQKEKVFDCAKKIKRECFGLNLAIMNQDEAMFKYLWNDHRLLWNLGHFSVCLKKIIETKWNKGIRMMFSAPTSKVIILSVNDVPNFIQALKSLGQLIEGFKKQQPKQYSMIKEYMLTRSFYLFCMFYELCHNLMTADVDYIDNCIKKLDQEDIPFRHSDIADIFDILDPKVIHRSIRKKFEQKFDNRDADIDAYLEKLAQIFESKSDKESNLQLLEDELDLFAYNTINIKGNPTNCLCEAMRKGFQYIIDYSFNEAFFNFRSIIKLNNKFEINNEIPVNFIDFFRYHQFDMEMFHKLYYYTIDVLQIVNFLKVFDSIKNMEVFDFILNDPKFISLFESSLEMQKYVFTKETMELKSSLKKEIHDILKNEPYQYYYGEIKRGNYGDDYQQLTLNAIEQQLEEKKQNNNNNSNSNKTPTVKAVTNSPSPPQTMSLIRLKQASEGQSPVGSDASITKLKKIKNNNHDDKKGQNKKQKKQQQPFMSEQSESPEQIRVEDDSQFISEGDSDNGKDQDRAKPRESVADMALENKNKFIIEGSPKNKQVQHMDSSSNSIHFKSQVSTLSKQGTGKDSAKRLNIFNKKITQNAAFDKKITISKEYNINEVAAGVMTSSPQLNGQQSTQRQPYQFEIMKAAISQSNKDDYEKLADNMIQSIKDNDMDSLKYLLQKFSIKNVAWLKYGTQDKTKASPKANNRINGKESLFQSEYSNRQSPVSNGGSPKAENCPYDTHMWNPILFAIYYKRIEILKYLMKDYQKNFVNAIRMPPLNEFSEYIVPNQKINMLGGSPERQDPLKNYVNQSLESENPIYVSPNKAPAVIQYYPSSANVECFGLQIAIKNRDIQSLKYLWDDQKGIWEERHFAFVLDKVLEEHWDTGIGSIFRSATSKVIFTSLNAEDKDNFLSSKIIDKITNSEYWQSSNNNSPTKITEQQVKIVIQELQYEPYGPYAVLRFPKLFDSVKLLRQTLKLVKPEDICDFIVARQENQQHLLSYAKAYSGKSKTKDELKSTIEKVKAIAKGQQKLPINPVKIVQLVKFGDLGKLKSYFSQENDSQKQLRLLNQLQGYEDAEYNKIFESNVVFTPKDDTINIIFAENSTAEWNPLIYAIFYQQLEAVKYFCEQESVYVRNCLTAPFIIELEDEMDIGDEEMFIKEKTELISLVLCAMLNNVEIFEYLWEQCAYIWNDIHLVLLINYLFEGQWQEGIEAILKSENSHQIFNSMNMYEKEKFLKFCEKSITKQASLADNFRCQMATSPYNSFYLPILISADDLRNWDKDQDKEQYLKNLMQNFDSRSFSLMHKYNKSYVDEFVDLSSSTGSKDVKAFAKKIVAFQQGLGQISKQK